ncbi:DUF4430 domain-containing protein [Bacillota bacterium Lsc_1132]
MPRSYKKITFFIIFVLLLSLIGCSSSAAVKETNQKAGATATQKVDDNKVTKKAEYGQGTEKAGSNTSAPTPSEQSRSNTSNTAAPKPAEQPIASANSSTTKAPAVTVKTSGSSTVAPAANPPAAAPVKSAAAAPAPAPAKTVTFSIVGPKEDHSADRAPSPVNIKDGDTILDVLLTAVGKGNVDYSGSGASAYVSGIMNIYEFDYGAKSGWTFKLNGVGIPKSAGVISVKNGDRIECIYVE